MGNWISKIRNYDFIYDTNKKYMCEKCWKKLSSKDCYINYKDGYICASCDRDMHPFKYNAFRDFR